MKMSRGVRALAAVALAGAAALAGAGQAGAGEPAGAGTPAPRTCAPGDLEIRIGERPSPLPDTERLFVIGFRSLKNGWCVLSGALDYIRFYDTAGRPLDVRFTDKDAVAPFDQVWVTDLGGPVVYVAGPKGGEVMPIGSLAFSMPTAPVSETRVAWPSPTSGPLRFTKIVPPAS